MKRYNIKLMNTKIEEEEILKYKDFNGLLSRFGKFLAWKKFLIGSTSVGSLIIVVSASFYFLGSTDEQVGKDPAPITSSEIVVQQESKEPKDEKMDKNTRISEMKPIEDKAPIMNVDEFYDSEVEDRKVDSKADQTVEIGEASTYSFVKATPIIGYDSLYSFLSESFRLPDDSSGYYKGQVLISFAIDTLGSPRNVQIVNGMSKIIDEEAVRLIKSMPKWNPASLNGKAVETTLTIPIRVETIRKTNGESNE